SLIGPAVGTMAAQRSRYFWPRYQVAPPPTELPTRYVRSGSALYSLAIMSATFMTSCSPRILSSSVSGAFLPPPPPLPFPCPPPAPAGRTAATISYGLLYREVVR